MSDWKISPLRPSGVTVNQGAKLYKLLRETGENGKLRGGEDGMRKRLKEALSVREKALFLTATLSPRFERVIGTGAFYCQPTASGWMYFIKDISVDSKYRRKGVGRDIVNRLLKHAREVAKNVGNGPIFVYSEAKPHQKAAGKFFESVGFSVESLAVGTSRDIVPIPATRYVIRISRKENENERAE